MKKDIYTAEQNKEHLEIAKTPGFVSKKRIPWNKGKKKPYADQYDELWCACDNPKLTSNFHERGQASCLLCGYPWFH